MELFPCLFCCRVVKRRKAWGLPKRVVGGQGKTQDNTRQERGEPAKSLVCLHLFALFACRWQVRSRATFGTLARNLNAYGRRKRQWFPCLSSVHNTTHGKPWKLEVRRLFTTCLEFISQFHKKQNSQFCQSRVRPPCSPAAAGRNTVVGGCAIPKPRSSMASCRFLVFKSGDGGTASKRLAFSLSGCDVRQPFGTFRSVATEKSVGRASTPSGLRCTRQKV